MRKRESKACVTGNLGCTLRVDIDDVIVNGDLLGTMIETFVIAPLQAHRRCRKPATGSRTSDSITGAQLPHSSWKLAYAVDVRRRRIG